MSKVIKASRVIGEYQLEDKEVAGFSPQRKTEIDRSTAETDPNKAARVSAARSIEQAEKEIAAARQEAEAIIAEAREQVAGIEEQVKSEAERMMEEASQAGYQEGLEAGHQEGYQTGQQLGYEEGRQEFVDGLQLLDTAISQIREEMDYQINKLPGEVIKLATRIASRIIKVQLKVNPELISDIILDMLKDINNTHDEIRIKVNPDLINYIDKTGVENSLAGSSVRFIADSNLIKGDCIIETNFGGKDGTLRNRLEIIEEELIKGAAADDEES